MWSPLQRKKSGCDVGHRPEDAVAAEVGIDAPALAGDVRAPDERNVALVGRRRPERTRLRLAQHGRVAEILQRDPVLDAPAGRKPRHPHLAREVGSAGQDRPFDPLRSPAVPTVEDLHEHPAWPVRARPDDARPHRDLTALDPVRDDRTRAHEGGRAPRSGDERGTGNGARLQELAAAQWHRGLLRIVRRRVADAASDLCTTSPVWPGGRHAGAALRHGGDHRALGAGVGRRDRAGVVGGEEPTPGLEPGTPSLRVKCSTS